MIENQKSVISQQKVIINEDLPGRQPTIINQPLTYPQVQEIKVAQKTVLQQFMQKIPLVVTPVGVVLGPQMKKLPGIVAPPLVSHIYNGNHMYGISLINSGLHKKDVMRRASQPMTYSNFPPAVKLHKN